MLPSAAQCCPVLPSAGWVRKTNPRAWLASVSSAVFYPQRERTRWRIIGCRAMFCGFFCQARGKAKSTWTSLSMASRIHLEVIADTHGFYLHKPHYSASSIQRPPNKKPPKKKQHSRWTSLLGVVLLLTQPHPPTHTHHRHTSIHVPCLCSNYSA